MWRYRLEGLPETGLGNHFRMANTVGAESGTCRGVVAVGASAGGIEALIALAAGLPEDLPYAVLITLHMSPGAPSVLAETIGPGGISERYTQLADEAERAVTVLGRRLSEATSETGEPGAG